MERLLWADGVRIKKVHEGVTYERPFDGVARKLERLHVDKSEDQISNVAREAYRRLFRERPCPDCGGARLNAAALAVELAGGWTIGRLVECELAELDRALGDLVERDDSPSSASTPRVPARSARGAAIWRSSCRFSTTSASTARCAGASGTGRKCWS